MSEEQKEFDEKKALSERDKKITELTELLKVKDQEVEDSKTEVSSLSETVSSLKDSMKSIEQKFESSNKASDGYFKDGKFSEEGFLSFKKDLLDEVASISSRNKESAETDHTKTIEELTNKVSDFKKQSIRTQLNLDSLLKNDGVREKLKNTKYSPYDPESPTLEKVLDLFVEKDDLVGIKGILDSLDDSDSNDHTMPSIAKRASTTPEQKKLDADTKKLESKRKAAMAAGEYDKALEITNEIENTIEGYKDG